MFTAPAEVWCCAFVGDNDDGDTNIVATGGDEGSWKLWDLRTSLAKPVHHCPDDFDAGVTVISPHPRQSHLLVVGSYDETIALYDARYQSLSQQQPKSIFHSSSLGGGIWRCKWHPHDHNRLLVAAMHGGCRVVTFDGLISGTDEDTDTAESPPIIMTVDQAFTEHKSMAYGADWLVYGSSEKTRTEVAASCSFYDQAMYLWETPSKHQQ
jgi:diphthamide biosynthesis protein 7